MKRIFTATSSVCLLLFLWIALLAARPALGQDAFQPGDVVIAPDVSAQGKEGVVKEVRPDGRILVLFPTWDGKWDRVNGPTQLYTPGELKKKGQRRDEAPNAAPNPAPPVPGNGGGGGDFAVGDKVIAPDGGKGREGTVKEVRPDGILVLFPNWDGKVDPVNGPTQLVKPELLTKVGADPAPRPAPQPQPEPQPQPAPGPENPRPDGDAGKPAVPPVAPDGPPLTPADIVAFLRKRLPANHWGDPRKEAVDKELAALVEKRGVSFRWRPGGKDETEIINAGGNQGYAIEFMKANFGSPAKRDWLMGTWKLGVYTTRPAPNGKVDEVIFEKTGSLVINPDHTYTWQTPRGPIAGTWRDATREEMVKKFTGGEGLVLQNADAGEDYLVRKTDFGKGQKPGIAVTDVEDGGRYHSGER